jgi:sterol desaturase/sphingolipid hydroxylase (fatty acid hydroxylase superfamily)
MLDSMEALLLAHEASVRLGCFVAVLGAMAAWEVLSPRRALSQRRSLRWTNNLALAAFGTLLVRIALPVAAVGVAEFTAQRGLGLLNALRVAPVWAFPISLVALDLVIYLQHRLFHAVPLLWRLHRVHHADLDFDVTTGARFHPLEILLSMLVKFAAVLALGAPAAAVLAFEIVLNATSMFNHGNVGLWPRVDRVLRLFVVTPEMHRVHHSIERLETDSNFGFSLPWWDRLFATYCAQPAAGHEAMTIGIDAFRDTRELGLDRMLLQPFRRDLGARFGEARREAG